MWGRCPKCQHSTHVGTFVRPQGIQQSENCAVCGWEEVMRVKVGGRWERPDHTPLPDPEVTRGRIRHAKVKLRV